MGETLPKVSDAGSGPITPSGIPPWVLSPGVCTHTTITGCPLLILDGSAAPHLQLCRAAAVTSGLGAGNGGEDVRRVTAGGSARAGLLSFHASRHTASRRATPHRTLRRTHARRHAAPRHVTPCHAVSRRTVPCGHCGVTRYVALSSHRYVFFRVPSEQHKHRSYSASFQN